MIPGVFAAAVRTAVVPRLWTPADMAVPPSIWLDSSSSVSEFSGRATEWQDVSGHGVHYLQSSSSRRPLVATGTPANVRVLYFDNNQRAMQASGGLDVYRNTNGLWMIAVTSRASVAAGDNNIAWLNNNVGSSSIALRGSDGSGGHAARFRRIGSDSVEQVSGPNSSGWHVHLCVADFAAGSATYIVDGTSMGTVSVTVGSTADADSSIPPGVGAWDSQYEGGVFQMAANLVGRGPLPLKDRQKLEGWAAWQYGLQDSLPVGHPYMGSPPTA